MRVVLTASAAVVTAAAAVAVAALYRRRRKRAVIITGGCGNLGTKLATHLLQTTDFAVVLIEHPDHFKPECVPAGASVVLGDLTDGAGSWRSALRGPAYALVHFSAVNPYPNASWADSAASMSQTFNVFLAAQECGLPRVILATSNHVMGGYKDVPEHVVVTPACPPRCGTLLRDPTDRLRSGDAVAYAAAKLAGEQLARALAARGGGATTYIALRIGWCQPGDNLPSTLNPSGSPPQFQNEVDSAPTAAAADQAVDENWFKNMWLSNGDFLRYFTAAIDAPVASGKLLLLNAMSGNSGMRWSLEETVAALGVTARDDSRA
jgi:nucleoside-diphosphate-sugar epimerase